MLNTIKTVHLDDMGREITLFHSNSDFDGVVRAMIQQYPNSLIEVRFTK